MPANSVLVGNTLGVTYQTGVDSKGKDIFKGQNFKNISNEATDDNLVALADAIEGILDYTISTIRKEQSFILTRE